MKFKFDNEAPPATQAPAGVPLGWYVGGDLAIPVHNGIGYLPYLAFKKPIVIIGKTGAGKSGTTSVLFDGAGQASPTAWLSEEDKEQLDVSELLPAQFIMLDGNADLYGMAPTFGAAMAATGRDTRFFPQERFNAWPAADWQPIFNRLLQIIPFAEEGAGAFYTNASEVILQRACRLGGVPPSSSKDLYSRLDYDRLLNAYGLDGIRGITPKNVEDLYMRCESVFAHCGLALDGIWSISDADVDAAYFGFNALVLGKSTVTVTQMILSQLEYYIACEKQRGRQCFVIIDEFASFAGKVKIGTFIEHARKLGACVIVISQTVRGLGDSTEIARILHNAGLVLVHTTPEWYEIQELIGLETVPEMSLRNESGMGADMDRLRMIKEAKVSSDELLGLANGEVYALCDNRAMRLKIELPDKSQYQKEFKLPKQEELFEPVGAGEAAAEEVEPPSYLTKPPRTQTTGFHRADFEIPPEDAASSAGNKPLDAVNPESNRQADDD